MGDSIFDLGDKFSINSPWEKSNNSFQVIQASSISVKGYWSSDYQGTKKITTARLYDTVYFQFVLSGQSGSKNVRLKLYEADSFSSTSLGYSASITVSNNRKANIKLKIKKEWKKHLDNDYGSFMELFWKVEIGGKTYSLDSVPLNVYEDEYFSAIHKNDYRYTCNCGWIDKSHAFTDTKRKRTGIGVKSLWSQIVNEDGLKSSWGNGFKVIYTQDAKIGPLYPGVTKIYYVEYGLSTKVKEEIALSIFQEVSIEFEAFQAYGAIVGRGSSSFEPADLISNLISFYRILRPKLTEKIILKKCNELDLQKSIAVYKKYPGTFSSKKYKNKKFTPRLFQTKHCSSTVFPPELQQIKTREKSDETFRDWIDLFDIHEGKPPITGPKW